jgi:ribonuclease HI
MPWARFLFKNQQKIFARVDEKGALKKDGHLIEIRYQQEGKSYKAQLANLSELPEGKGPLIPDEDKAPEASSPATLPKVEKAAAEAPPESPPASNEVIIYADGACSGNPGPAGIGVYLRDSQGERDVSEYLGHGTNNIAELTAIKRALELCPDKNALIKIYTDSSYSIGVLTQNWKAKANQSLIADLRTMLRSYPRVKFIKVAGHAGIPGNERADMLARRAVENR